ncbi:MAG TPA: MtrAB system histidine kinase MtrB, partial [Mycobacteriales bacterium]|nr:MtrAB system histidine kinase MtrB [Mycobacteriales bacterium]
DSVPARLRAAVETTGGTEYTYTRLRYTTGGSEPALVVGASLAGSAPGQYELYYLFPLRREVQTISLVQRTELFSGLLLVGLLVAIAALVTRQVVSPVRLAARGAERLAAGRLEERLPIRGEDDLARLASSFNRMAVNLQRQIGRLEELSRVQRRFVADVSHELRTPLTTVRMAADVLHGARDGFAPAAARSAELLLGQLDRFESLLADLLEISRHDAGVVVLEPEPVDLTGIVRRVVEATDPLAARRGCVVRVAAPEHPVVAEVDPRRVERVLRNLLVNALEHGEGRPVDVTVRGGPTSVAIAVRDRGVGLRPGEAALVFNRFWRADPARARSSGGSGLGLSISLEDTRLHGGWLQAWGRPGQGAQFRLTLPRRAGGELTDSPLALDPDELAPAAAVAASRSGPTAEPGAGPEPSP